MHRRRFVRLAGITLASAGIAGCAGSEADTGETATLDAADADVSASVVKNAPDNPGPYENESIGGVTDQKSDALALDGLVFQRAGEKGLVVAGDATNTSGRAFATVAVKVTLYGENDAEDGLQNPVSERDTHGRLDAEETWQWAATFGDQPDFQVVSYAVTVAANYE